MNRIVSALCLSTLLLGACDTAEGTDPGAEEAMRLDDNKEVIQAFVDELKNAGDLQSVDRLTTEDFVQHFPDPSVPPGREGTKQVRAMLGVAFPDMRVTVQDLVAEGDRVTERSIGEATHQGELFGIPATGNPVVWTETHVYRIEDGRIAEHWPQIDLLGILTQIEAVPPLGGGES